jgi:response regulator RpfG family c-di-GMP phosphodiesterase
MDLPNLNLLATCPQPQLVNLKNGDPLMTFLYNERRRILLIDEDSRKLTLRANVLRNLEVEVHLARGLEEARSLWKNIPYDLVLLAAAENSEQATLVSLQIRKSRPRQRIALLVGPPAYIREIGRPSTKALHVSPVPQATMIQGLSGPQWPEIVQKVVSDWFVDQPARFALRGSDRAATGDLPFLAD